ncbi:hypothetical protein BH10CHL1_BH10CHL1_23790 [soil metagenome]
MHSVTLSTPTLSSAPALGTALRNLGNPTFAPAGQRVPRSEIVVPMYRINNHTVEQEAETAAYVVSNAAERLRRLSAAYAQWDKFDAPAYFDLSKTQTAQLVKLVERVNTVHVTFFADLLLPSFQQAVDFWAQEFAPRYQQMRQQPTLGPAFVQDVQPIMVQHWQHLLSVIEQTRIILSNDVGFLATNGAQEERERWRRWWANAPVAGLDSALSIELAELPTLTLSFDFPLPAYRQPDRLRRLYRNRERQLARRRRHK